MNDIYDLELNLKNLGCVYSSRSNDTLVEEYQHNNISVTIENTFSGAYISIEENYTNYPVVVSYVANMLDNSNQDFDISTDYVTNNINFNIYTSPGEVEEILEKIDKFIGFLEA